MSTYSIQVRTPLALLNALHSRQGFSTLVVLVNLIHHLMPHFYKICKSYAQIKLIPTPIWHPWILSPPTHLITCITKTFWTIRGYFSQTRLFWVTPQQLHWSTTIASGLFCFSETSRCLWRKWVAWVCLQDSRAKLGETVGRWTKMYCPHLHFLFLWL